MNTHSILNLGRTIGLYGFILAALVIIFDKVKNLASGAISLRIEIANNHLFIDWSLAIQTILWVIIAWVVFYEGWRAVKHKQFFMYDRAHSKFGIPGALALALTGVATLAVVAKTHLFYWYSITYFLKYPLGFQFNLLTFLVLISESIFIRNKLLNKPVKQKQPVNFKALFTKIFQWIQKFGVRTATIIVCLSVIFNSFYYVPEGNVAVIANAGRFDNKPLRTPGINIKIPFYQEASVYVPYNSDRTTIPVLDDQAIEIYYYYQLKEEYGRTFLRQFIEGHQDITFDVRYNYLSSIQRQINNETLTLDEADIKNGLSQYLKTVNYSEFDTDKTTGWFKYISVDVKLKTLKKPF